MKTREERLKRLREIIINAGMGEKEKQLVIEFIEVRYKKEFEEASDRVLEIFEFILQQLHSANSRHTVFINEMIAKLLHEHEYLENWVQLSQINRTLPDHIIVASRNDVGVMKNIIDRAAKAEKIFDNLPLEEKEKLVGGKQNVKP